MLGTLWFPAAGFCFPCMQEVATVFCFLCKQKVAGSLWLRFCRSFLDADLLWLSLLRVFNSVLWFCFGS